MLEGQPDPLELQLRLLLHRLRRLLLRVLGAVQRNASLQQQVEQRDLSQISKGIKSALTINTPLKFSVEPAWLSSPPE